MNTVNRKQSYGLISKYRALLMGAAILLIMFCHLDTAETHHGLENTLLALLLHTGTVGVDIFMFLSGFGLYYSSSKKPLPYWQFEKKRMVRILPYYFLIGGLTYLIYDLLIEHVTVGKFLQDLLFISWYREGSRKYWYILASMVFYLLFPGMDLLIRKKRHAFLKIALFSVIWFAAVETLSRSNEKFDLFRIALDRLPIFTLGVYTGKLAYEGRTVKGVHTAFYIFMGMLLFVLQIKVIPFPWSRYLYYPIRGTLAISVISLVILFMEALEKKAPRVYHVISKVLVWFGGLTLELYLLHQSYMLLLDSPCKLPAYCMAAFVLPTISAAGIYWVRAALKKRKTHDSLQHI